MTQPRARKRFLDCKGMTIEEAEQWGKDLAEMQRDIMWWVADLARYSEARWPDTHHQVWPEWISPGMIARAAGVGKAYPTEFDREWEATYSQYMQNAGRLDRHKRLEAIVDKGLTTDESRKADYIDVNQCSDEELLALGKAVVEAGNPPRWLLAVDVHYHLHRHWFSGAGVEAAVRVAEWVQRTVERLKEKGLTDVVCAFDSTSSFRKELTKDWEDKYKDRPPKDPELVQQLHLVRELLQGYGFCCVSQEGFEADDIMASYGKQFEGRITLLSADKDMRQCLSDHINILLDVEWTEDETSGDLLPDYKWLSAKQHTEAKGIRPNQWADYQAIMGDTVDGIKGAEGIGEKGAADLIREYGSIEGAIVAAKADDGRIKPKKRAALLELAGQLDVVRQLVTLRTDLELPQNTRV